MLDLVHSRLRLASLRGNNREGCVAIQCLLRRDKLTDDESCAFIIFAAAQMIRVESYFQRLDGMLTPILEHSAKLMFKHSKEFKGRVSRRLLEKMGEEKLGQFIASLERGEVKVTANRGYLVATFLHSLDTIARDFFRMKWSFVDPQITDAIFLLSDNPLILTDTGDGEPQLLGLRNPNTSLTNKFHFWPMGGRVPGLETTSRE